VTYQMRAKTKAGVRFVEAATDLIPVLRTRADEADRTGQVCKDNFKDLASSGIAAAFVPTDLGGYGLESVHDWLLGIATLARGDGSTAIGINMHLGVSRGMAQAFSAAVAQGGNSEGLRAPLTAIATGQMLICATATERGTDNLHPLTEARLTEEGWRIDGRKMFVTMSPVATHLGMNLRMQDDKGDHLVTTLLPIDTPGIQPQGDWDALGMRASGSQSIVFDNVRVAKSAVRRIGPWGQWSPNVLVNRTLGNLPLVAAFLGIAEHAYELVLQAMGQQKRLGEPVNTAAGVQHMMGEIEIELASCRSILQQAGAGVDEFLARYAKEPPPLDAAHELMKDYQCAKWVVNRGAIEIVSRAMDLVGGGGFMNAHPLARLYRDVRAGPFMQPFSPPEAREYVGKVALGILPQA
jgi:alkylation response protein AidB-like acyl-CoA dehydrogenase